MPKYFGFYGDGFDSWGDSIAQTAPFSNLHWIEHTETHKLDKIADLGHKAVVNISTLIFDHPRVILRTDAAERLIHFVENLTLSDSPIAAFLLFDEPWRIAKNNYPADLKEVTPRLNGASEFCHMIAPQVSTLVAASGGEFDTYEIPKSVDWLGMYRYSYNTYRFLLAISFWNLVRKKASHQKIMVIADSYADTRNPPDPSRIIAHNKTWQALVDYYEKEVIAVCPFLYQSPRMGDIQVWGADTVAMEKVRAQLVSWGYKIKWVTPGNTYTFEEQGPEA